MQNSLLEQKLQEYKNPLVVIAFGLLLGFALYYARLTPCYVLVLVVFTIGALFRNKILCFLSLVIVLGSLYSSIYFHLVFCDLDLLIGKRFVYLGEVISNADERSKFNNKYFFRLNGYLDHNLNERKLNSKVLVYGSKFEKCEIGDIIQLKGVLKDPKKAILPGLFSEKRYLFSKGVKYVLKADSGSTVYLKTNKFAGLARFTTQTREKFNLIYQYYLEEDNINLLNGIVFGSKASDLNKKVKEKIQTLGLAHITSASGFNVSILAFFVFYLCRFFSKNKFIPSFIAIFLVLIYSSFADYSTSVLRASVFIILVLIGNLFNKKIKILPAISLIIISFFIFAPYSVLDIGLQLSIVAFLGLVLFVDELRRKINLKNKLLNFLLFVFFQSLIAQLSVIPLIVFHFHNIQILGLLSNILAVPCAALILIFGLITVPFVLIPQFNILVSFFAFIQHILTSLFLIWMKWLYLMPC
ncbi:MAG: ComEC/Rec2 family competence protein, partial [Candidatus Melainabacteria bacterium]|nr:ComEC/Rec2 family competence protein [Candidatus Melainabacteria bacterium]